MITPLISVIVPIYNASETLDRCVQSILEQTYSNFELILVNDGSHDDSGDKCEEYANKDKRVRVFHKSNGGASSARNLGLTQAQGDWITFCDSDDWVYPSWLQNFVDNAHDVDYVCQGLETSNPIKSSDLRSRYIYGISYCGEIGKGIELSFKSNILGYTVVSLFKKELIVNNDLRFNTNFNIHEDQEFILRYLTYCNSMRCVLEVGYYYYLPDFGKKYIIQNAHYLNESIYKSVSKALGNKWGETLDHFLYLLLESFFETYELVNFKDKIKRTRRLRELVGKNILKSRLFLVTKWAIFLDFTALLSSLIISVHLKLKS